VGQVRQAAVLPVRRPVPRHPARPPAPVRPSPRPVPRTYLAAPGDTLIGIARKVYGAGHEDEYVRIFEANRDRLPDASTVRAGQELVIPPLQGASGPPAAARADRSAAPARRRHFREVTLEALQQELSPPRAGGTYVVRPGDCLTGIARRVMGDDSREAVQRLFESNRDRIHDPDSVPAGLVLRIPG
jgi:nucleoid-associated protein YgaU